jgi:hypothetical protein
MFQEHPSWVTRAIPSAISHWTASDSQADRLLRLGATLCMNVAHATLRLDNGLTASFYGSRRRKPRVTTKRQDHPPDGCSRRTLLALVGGQALACTHNLSKMHMLCLCKLRVARAEPVFCNASPAKRGSRVFAVEIQGLGAPSLPIRT